MTVAYSSCALGVNTAAYSLGSAIQRFLQIRPGPFTDRPLPIKRGPNPKRDPVLRGGKFTPRTLKDLEAAALNRRLHWYGAQMWTSLALEPMAWLQGAPGGGDPGGGDPGGGEGGTGTGGSGSGGSGGAGGGSAGGGSTGTGNTNVGNQLHSLPIVSWKAKGQTGIGLTLFHNSFGTYVGPWGESWSSSYDTDLTYTSGSSAIIRWGDGTNDAYTESSGTFTPPTGVHDSLV